MFYYNKDYKYIKVTYKYYRESKFPEIKVGEFI